MLFVNDDHLLDSKLRKGENKRIKVKYCNMKEKSERASNILLFGN